MVALIWDRRPMCICPDVANITTMTPPPPRSRLLLMPETRPAGERPKVRRYRLVRLPVNSPRAVRSNGAEHSKWGQAADHPSSYEEG